MAAIRPIEIVRPGHGSGPFNHVISDEAIQDRLKPFVYLDHFDAETSGRWGFPYHPHSGVATFTYTQTADLEHEDTGGNGGTVPQGSVQWMAAGGGLWHQEYYHPKQGRVAGLQLWLMLPPELENGPVAYQHAVSDELPVIGTTRILAGTFEGTSSPISTPLPFNYFDITLAGGDSWCFEPPAEHTVVWAYAYDSAVVANGQEIAARQLIVFGEQGRLEFRAAGDCRFVVGTAPPFVHSLVRARGSIHTSKAALEKGRERIAEIGEELRRAGKL
ncbi:MAG: pirin family protein [Planctomycetes bacterium]|nr:pirin family protein [Planctomycetota bacterium]